MSLPAGQRNWINCPFCKEVEDIWRQGEAGVPPSRYGERMRVPDSTLFKCNFCGEFFHSEGATRREVMGYNVSGRDRTAY